MCDDSCGRDKAAQAGWLIVEHCMMNCGFAAAHELTIRSSLSGQQAVAQSSAGWDDRRGRHYACSRQTPTPPRRERHRMDWVHERKRGVSTGTAL